MQAIKIFSVLSFISADDTQERYDDACFIICKIIPLLMIDIYTFKTGKGLKVENEGYLVAGAISFWIISFFTKSYNQLWDVVTHTVRIILKSHVR